MKDLLSLKEQYKTLTGTEYKPSTASAQKENQKPASAVTPTNADALTLSITQQGEKVRDLKANKSSSKVSTTKQYWDTSVDSLAFRMRWLLP